MLECCVCLHSFFPKEYQLSYFNLVKKMSSGGENMEDAAIKRRERLKNLRKNLSENTSKCENDNSDASVPKPVFRSYQPADESLKDNVLPKAKPESVEEHVKDHLEAAKPAPLISEVGLTTLAPRKPDWDLKRDVAKKLEKLERRTQRAIAELIRERLKSSEENLAEAVNTYAGDSVPPDDDSDEE